MHLPGTDHEAGAKAEVRKHRQYHRDETEQRADYQGEEKVQGFTSNLNFQNDKAFNASKEDMEFIDNNEETNKVRNLIIISVPVG